MNFIQALLEALIDNKAEFVLKYLRNAKNCVTVKDVLCYREKVS